MFCSKCGKTIDDNATFCSFCGNTVTNAAASAPVEAAPQTAAPQQAAPQYSAPQQAAPQYSTPQQAAPQYTAPQQAAPQYTAPQQGAPQYGAPQYGAPQGQYGYPAQTGPVLTPAAINVINKIMKAILGILAVLVLIGSIGSLATFGSMKSGNITYNSYTALQNFTGLARVPAIIAFSFAAIDIIFTLVTKQKSILTYINAGIGVILFTFNFVMYGNMNEYGSEAGFIVACIFLLVGSVALLASTMLTLFNKEQLLFRPRTQMPPMPPTPPSYPPYQQ